MGLATVLAVVWIARDGLSAPVAVTVIAPSIARVEASRVVYFEAPEAPASVARTREPARSEALELSASESLQFSTLCDLQMAAADMDLDLTTKQWQAFAAAVVQAQAVRHSYEAQIAKATEIAPGRYRIEIPAYASAGDELRRQFLADLQRGLGSDAADEVIKKFARRFEGKFAGFGVSSQTLEIKGDVTRALSQVEVTRTARYWDSAEGRDHVTTRHEVVFPADEDPSGERWGALLALVATAS